jgi:alkaline phosphatase D
VAEETHKKLTQRAVGVFDLENSLRHSSGMKTNPTPSREGLASSASLITRRELVAGSFATLASLTLPHRLVSAEQGPTVVQKRPTITDGVQVGLGGDSNFVVWARADSPARMYVEWATTPTFKNGRRVGGSAALPGSDFTARALLKDLPANEHIFYRVTMQDLSSLRSTSAPLLGAFKTPPLEKSDLTFIWSGDTAGQGFGINPEFGGMKLYKVMQSHNPDLFIHAGDLIYADAPIQREVKLPDGSVWRNIVTEAKSKVAESVEEFRGNYRYNLLDENVRAFNASVAQVVLWDDHETTNNWDPFKQLEDPRYKEKSCALLAARAKQALFEYTPLLPTQGEPERIYSRMSYGPSADLFRLDARSYRGPNSLNVQTIESPETAFFGAEQITWLKAELLRSKATWKVIVSDMPLGLIVPDGKAHFEAIAQGDGPPKGRELELASLLRFMKAQGIKNTVWLTADVHYAAAHYYDPAKAQFTEFEPFWEFVAGPINAGTFGPNQLDNTFGPNVMFQSVPRDQRQGESPRAGKQFFGKLRLDKKTDALTVSLHNLANEEVYRVELLPRF